MMQKNLFSDVRRAIVVESSAFNRGTITGIQDDRDQKISVYLEPLRRLQVLLGLADTTRDVLCGDRRPFQREFHQHRQAYDGQRRCRRGALYNR